MGLSGWIHSRTMKTQILLSVGIVATVTIVVVFAVAGLRSPFLLHSCSWSAPISIYHKPHSLTKNFEKLYMILSLCCLRLCVLRILVCVFCAPISFSVHYNYKPLETCILIMTLQFLQSSPHMPENLQPTPPILMRQETRIHS